MESVCGESNSWGNSPMSIGRSSYYTSSESVIGESVSSPATRSFTSESTSSESMMANNPIRSSNYPDTPRIRQLRRELSELQAELDLAQQIDQVKQKVKKYRN